MSLAQGSDCPFCFEVASSWEVGDTHNYWGFDCQICKTFFISNVALENVRAIQNRQPVLNCIAENIRSNASYGKEIITSWHLRSEFNLPSMAANITVKRLEDFLTENIDHASKIGNLLLALAEKAQKKSPFSTVTLSLSDLYSLKIADFKECVEWLNSLQEGNKIDSTYLKSKTLGRNHTNNQIQNCKINLTTSGWRDVQSAQSKQNSKKVFIAMQFDWGDEALNKVRTKYIEAIKSGCDDCGYEADIVSQNHTDYITDRIVSEIKISKFVIADFTFNNQGVYYEAGLARGLGKKVIHTVKEKHTSDSSDKFKQLHFDIKQINYIEWTDPTELRTLIADRIKSTIEGM